MSFQCVVCGQQPSGQRLSLDRRVQQVSTGPDGKPLNVLQINFEEALFLYCGHACWTQHEAHVAELLEARSTYPSSEVLVPCSRCGAILNRTSAHISYAIIEWIEEDSNPHPTIQVVDDNEFVVLCSECEVPSAPEWHEAEEPAPAAAEMTA